MSDYGVVNALLYACHRTAQKLDPAAVIERFYIVAQPVPALTGLPAQADQKIIVRRLTPSNRVLRSFTRIPEEIEDRFAQGAVCLGAFRGEDLLGWLWFVPSVFRDFTHPVTFNLDPTGSTAWDFDVYVRPDARLSRTFARLWTAAFRLLQDMGITQSLSAISAYNPGSVRAHHRLGTKSLGSILILRIGRFQAVISRSFAPHVQCSARPGFRATLRVAAPAALAGQSGRPERNQ